jgi:hypothetical protein
MYCAVNLHFCTASRLKPPPWRDVACRCRAGPRYCQKGKDRVCRQIAQPPPKSGDRYRGHPTPLHLYCHPCGVLYSIPPSTLSHLVYYHTYLTVSYSPYCSIILTLQHHTCTIIQVAHSVPLYSNTAQTANSQCPPTCTDSSQPISTLVSTDTAGSVAPYLAIPK